MKSPVIARVSPTQLISPWVPIDYISSPISVGLAVVFTTTSNFTVQVQYTLDELNWGTNSHPVSWTRTGTTMTVTDTGNGLGGNPDGVAVGYHGLLLNDNVILKGTPGGLLDSPRAAGGFGDIGYQVASVTSETTYTLTVPNTGAASDASGNSQVIGLRVFPHDTLVGLTSRALGSITYGPAKAIRLYTTSGGTAGAAELLVVQGLST